MVPTGKGEVLWCCMLNSSRLLSLHLSVACVPALPHGHKPLVRVRRGYDSTLFLLLCCAGSPCFVLAGSVYKGLLSLRSLLAVMCSGDIHCNYLVANDHSVIEGLF